MKERLPWFRCFPSALLGAMAGMTPEEGYTYVAVLLRIYETGGPVAETTRTLSRRTGLTERKVRAALESLISAGKVKQDEDGRLDSDSTHDELSWQSQCRENNSKAGKSSAAQRAGKAQQTQRTPATRVQQSRNHIDEEKEHTPSGDGVATRASADLDLLERRLREAAGDAVNAASPGLLNLSAPLQWLANGCDLERDILPTIRARSAGCARDRIQTWAFFTGAVADAYATRTAKMSPGQPGGRGPPETTIAAMNTVLNRLQGKSDVPQHTGPTIDASDDRRDRGGPSGVVQLLPAAARHRA